MHEDRILINPQSVIPIFKLVHTDKATGPDNMSAFLLKTFAEELTPAWHQLYQLSIDTHSVPELWKRSVIIPVPKKACPQVNNGFRPVALTSNVQLKSLEKLLIQELHIEVEPHLD